MKSQNYLLQWKISEVNEGSFLPPLPSVYIVAHLLKARIVEPETKPFLCKARIQSRGIVTTRDVTRTAIAMEQLGKHISKETNSRNIRRAVFSVRSLPKGYKRTKKIEVLSFKMPDCQDMSLGVEELNWGPEPSELLGEFNCELKVWLWSEYFMYAVVQWY
jgi:hypothetical protein